jgi:site-specific recombinase XerC
VEQKNPIVTATLDKYEKVTPGITYDAVVQIMGREGEELFVSKEGKRISRRITRVQL